MGQVPGTPVALSNSTNSTIDGLDVSWTEAGLPGTGISLLDSQGITVQNVAAANRGQPLYSYWGASSPPTLGNRYLNNDLSHADWGLTIYGDTQFVASGNDYTGDTNGWNLYCMTGLSLTSAKFETAVGQVPGTAIALSYSTNSAIDGLDVSWPGAGRSGTGISLWDSQDITVQHVAAANRSTPLRSYCDWSSPPTLGNRYLSNDLSNADWGLIVYQDTQFVASGTTTPATRTAGNSNG